MEALTDEALVTQFSINVNDAVYAVQAAVKHFGPHSGAIINSGSIIGASPGAGMAA